MVYPKDLWRYFELTGLSFEEVAQVLRNSLRTMPLTGSNLPHSVVEEGIIHRVFPLTRIWRKFS